MSKLLPDFVKFVTFFIIRCYKYITIINQLSSPTMRKLVQLKLKYSTKATKDTIEVKQNIV